ncbi:MAG: hypothetical protein U9R21_05735 [Candidatus Thermoplasmatota archaeon]|nr:hypothetical protein [Candidatus Thermoplasmatota archaeon]
MSKCKECNGTGKLPNIFIPRSDTHDSYFQRYNETCPECFGTGIINLNTMIKHLNQQDINKGLKVITKG